MRVDRNSDSPIFRTPFRVMAFALGMMFVAVGTFQLTQRPNGLPDFAFAICIFLTGVLFTYSALTKERKSHFEILGLVAGGHSRFVAVEPIQICSSNVDENSHRISFSPNRSLNPYQPPTSWISEPKSWRRLFSTLSSQPASLHKEFLAGRAFIHYGVVFFLEPSDQSVIHAALPLVSFSDAHVSRNVIEAIRVFPEFLSTLPELKLQMKDRRLAVRMISSYDDLDDEVSDRVVCELGQIGDSS